MSDQERRTLARACRDARASLERAQLAWAEQARRTCIDGMAYLVELQLGFFAPLHERTVAAMLQGRGSEFAPRSWPVADSVRADGTVSRRLLPAKAQALLSSSVLCLNVFDYWRGRIASPLAAALGIAGAITDVALEAPLATGVSPAKAHLDVLLLRDGIHGVGVESKFTEWLGVRPAPERIPAAYVGTAGAPWARQDLPRAQALAAALATGTVQFRLLDAPQLLKHMLALATAYGSVGLLYLYYDVNGVVGNRHRAEIAQFAAALDATISFRAVTYQDLVRALGRAVGDDRSHDDYFAYLASRYGLVR